MEHNAIVKAGVVPHDAPLRRRFLNKLVIDVLPAALTSVIGGFLVTQYQFNHSAVLHPVAEQVVPASAEMIRLVRDEHGAIMDYIKAQIAAEKARNSAADVADARAVADAKLATEKAAADKLAAEVLAAMFREIRACCQFHACGRRYREGGNAPQGYRGSRGSSAGGCAGCTGHRCCASRATGTAATAAEIAVGQDARHQGSRCRGDEPCGLDSRNSGRQPSIMDRLHGRSGRRHDYGAELRGAIVRVLSRERIALATFPPGMKASRGRKGPLWFSAGGWQRVPHNA